MNQEFDNFEIRVRHLAADFPYPPTPDLAAGMAEQLAQSHAWPMRRVLQRQRVLRPSWALLLTLLILFFGLWSITPVRAALLDWLQIGTVRIWQSAPPTPTHTPLPSQPAAASSTVKPTVRPTATPLLSILDFAGATTLMEASARVDFSILLPTLPSDLGEPDHVYLQRAEGDTVILVWMEPGQSDTVRMSLHLLGPGAFLWKMQPPAIAETTVNGEPALWTQGPYYIQAGSGGNWANRRLVDGYVLVWTVGEVTYRLESALPLAEAVQVAESLAVPRK